MFCPPSLDPILHLSFKSRQNILRPRQNGTPFCIEVSVLAIALVQRCPNFLDAENISKLHCLHLRVVSIMDTLSTRCPANESLFLRVGIARIKFTNAFLYQQTIFTENRVLSQKFLSILSTHLFLKRLLVVFSVDYVTVRVICFQLGYQICFSQYKISHILCCNVRFVSRVPAIPKIQLTKMFIKKFYLPLLAFQNVIMEWEYHFAFGVEYSTGT